MSLFKLMSDTELAERIRKLERQVANLRLATTAAGMQLYERFADALAEAMQELERRHTP